MSENKITKGIANSTDKFVAERIRTIRVLRGLSQQQIAQALNVSIQQVQKYEAGTNRISSGKLYNLAQFLELPINYFFDKDNYNQLDLDVINNINISEKEIIVLINSFISIKNTKLKKHLVGIMELISKF